jgi:hypothetical protein
MYAAFRLFGEALNLLMYRYTKKHFGNSPFIYASVLIFAAALYFPVYYKLPGWNTILTNPFIITASAIAAVSAWIYINRYDIYAPFWRDRIQNNRKLEIQLRENMTFSGEKADFNESQKWNKGLDTQNINSDKYKNKTGFAYLNAVFFDRHGKFFRNKILLRIGILLALGLMIGAMLSIGNLSFDLDSWEDVFMYAPAFFLIICAASMGRIVTSAVFANCDVQMLHYPYYRTKKNIFASFKARFFMILRYNSVITAFIAFSVVVFMSLFFGYIDYARAGVFVFLILCMGVFFAFSDLFLYYIIQPYDSAKNNKSKTHQIIIGLIGFFAYITFKMRINLINYTIFIVALTALYLSTGIMLLLHFAPKRFKLR